MKTLVRLFAGIPLLVVTANCCTAAGLDIRQPNVDAQGRFWVFASTNAPLPFLPYAWMPEEASKMMVVDTGSTNMPQGEGAIAGTKDTCVSVSINWKSPNWCGIAFLSGPQGPPPWWGEDDRGWAYDLRSLKHKRLIFYARSEQGARIKAKVGILGDKGETGDSLKFPAETKWLKLTKEWQRFSIELSRYKPEDLKRICNGFTFVVEKVQQDGLSDRTQFYLDTIYFE